MAAMANLFLGRYGTLLTYIILSVYLFGDLAIYSTTVPKSLTNIICSSISANSSFLPETSCHENGVLSRFSVYRICISVFALVCLPMIMIGVVKTKYFQLATTFARWLAFTLMIILTSILLLSDGPKAQPEAVNLGGFSALSGISVYAFMCHHSIPGLIAPMTDKSYFSHKLVSVYLLVFGFYTALSITGIFAFPFINDIYTLNFYHDERTGGVFWFLVDYFLALFPVFTLTSSYIIVAITLTNNMRTLISMGFSMTSPQGLVQSESETLLASNNEDEEHPPSMSDVPSLVDFQSRDQIYVRTQTHNQQAAEIQPVGSLSPRNRQFGWRYDVLHHVVPFVVVLIPSLISFFTDNVILLASITGSYPGVGVQFVIPAFLIIAARNKLREYSAVDADIPQTIPKSFGSPFTSQAWPLLILCWALFALVVVTVNLFR